MVWLGLALRSQTPCLGQQQSTQWPFLPLSTPWSCEGTDLGALPPVFSFTSRAHQLLQERLLQSLLLVS